MALPTVGNDVKELPVPLSPRALSSFVKAGISLLTTANVDMLVAFSTSYWATWRRQSSLEHGGYGLWKIWKCTDHPADDMMDKNMCNERMADLSFPGNF